MLQILTFLGAFCVVLKGLDFLHRAMAVEGPQRRPVMVFALLTFAACMVAAGGFVMWQNEQAAALADLRLDGLLG